ncbi:PucR family transcriptional regulator [Streptomyces aidingensis]|uniref:PucR family transcriptional regulator n=1 Tax=Streptomyces aidingensis TaxID=910347 RepID=UPI001FEBF79E|nr:helix-turn-helix domain-containing protein [Streptomyces aidingensis]
MHELPSLADEIVEILRSRIPGFSTFLSGGHREKIRWEIERAVLSALDDGFPAADGGHGSDGQTARPPGGAVRSPAASSPHHPTGAAAPGTGPGRGGLDGLDGLDGFQAGGLGRDLARHELFAALTFDPPVSEELSARLARRAGWPLPEQVRAVVLPEPHEVGLPEEVTGDVLHGHTRDQQVLLIPDPAPDPELRPALLTALRGHHAAVGHTVLLREAAASVRWARRLLDLAPAQSGPDAAVFFVDDHLSTLLLLQDETLLRALGTRWLHPLAGLTPRQSERLEVTLLAWLEGGGAPEAAKALKVHPQTVHYRLRQLEKLFGCALRDPRSRLELELTLHSRRLMAQMRNLRCRTGRRTRAAGAAFRQLGVGREARVNGR